MLILHRDTPGVPGQRFFDDFFGGAVAVGMRAIRTSRCSASPPGPGTTCSWPGSCSPSPAAARPAAAAGSWRRCPCCWRCAPFLACSSSSLRHGLRVRSPRTAPADDLGVGNLNGHRHAQRQHRAEHAAARPAAASPAVKCLADHEREQHRDDPRVGRLDRVDHRGSVTRARLRRDDPGHYAGLFADDLDTVADQLDRAFARTNADQMRTNRRLSDARFRSPASWPTSWQIKSPGRNRAIFCSPPLGQRLWSRLGDSNSRPTHYEGVQWVTAGNGCCCGRRRGSRLVMASYG